MNIKNYYEMLEISQFVAQEDAKDTYINMDCELYIKTLEEKECGFSLLINEHLKKERENYKQNSNDGRLEIDFLKKLKKEMENGFGLYESLMKILGSDDDSYIKDSIIIKNKILQKSK